MTFHDIHVVLISDQVLANLIPALMDRPDKVILVCTDAMARKGLDRRLESLLKRQAIATETRSGVPDAGLGRIHDAALALADQIDAAYPGAHITLNATGGTKLMAMGFIEAFRPLVSRIIYTDTAHRCIESLPIAKEDVPPPQPMSDVFDVPGYLAAQGFLFARAESDEPSWREAAAGRKAACKYLSRHAAAVPELIGALNALAEQALERIPGSFEERLAAPRQSLRNAPRGEWARALGELAKAGLIDWREGEAEIEFLSAEAARFLHGGWLEEYAWHVVRDERLHDVRMGVRGNWENCRTSTNEFDVLATHGNQLLYIECKTLRFHEGQGNDNDLAYKLDSLGQDLRGLFGETWLLSAREPTDVLRERARQARFRIIGPLDLPRLRDAVRAWKGIPP